MRTAVIMPPGAKRALGEEGLSAAIILSPGDLTMGYRFGRIIVLMRLEGRDKEWYETTLRCRAAPGCEWIDYANP